MEQRAKEREQQQAANEAKRQAREKNASEGGERRERSERRRNSEDGDYDLPPVESATTSLADLFSAFKDEVE